MCTAKQGRLSREAGEAIALQIGLYSWSSY